MMKIKLVWVVLKKSWRKKRIIRECANYEKSTKLRTTKIRPGGRFFVIGGIDKSVIL